MGFARCMFGDDCRKIPECRFIHPGDPEYERARPTKRTNFESAYLAEAKGESPGYWDKPRHQNANTSTLTQGIRKWGDPGSSKGPQPRSTSGDMGNASGSGIWNSTPRMDTSSSNLFPDQWDAGPGPSNNAASGTSSWEWATQAAPEQTSSGWGESRPTNQVDHQANGNESMNLDFSWKSPNTDNNPWDFGEVNRERATQVENSTVGTQPDPASDRGKGKSKAQDDIETSSRNTQDSAPQTTTTVTHVPSTWPSASGPTITTNVPLPTRRPRVSSNLVPPAMKAPVGPVPLPIRRNTTPIQQNMQEILVKKETDARRKGLVRPPDYYKGPEGRKRLFSHMIRVMISTALIYSSKKKAETNSRQVKAMATSPQYGRATRKTRDMLNQKYADAKYEMSSMEVALKEKLEELASLPDFAEQKSKRQDPRTLMRKVIGYTAELQEWFQGLKLDERTSVEEPVRRSPEKKAPPKIAKPVPQPPIAIPSTPSPSALKPSSLYERGNWTWEEIKNSLALMQKMLQEVDEEVHSALYTTSNDEQAREEQINEVDAALEELTQHLDADDDDEEDEEDEEVDELEEDGEVEDEQRLQRQFNKYRDRFLNALIYLSGVNEQVDASFSEEVASLSDLVLELHGKRQDIAAWRAQREELTNFCSQANAKLAEIEAWNAEAELKLEVFKQQVQELVSLKDELKQAAERPAAPPDFDFDALVEFIRPLLMQRVHREIQPMLQGISTATTQYQGDMIDKVNELVGPAIRSTDELCAKSIAATEHATSR